MPLAPSSFYLTNLATLHQQLLASPIVRAYFNGIAIRFDGTELLPQDKFDLQFGIFSTVEFAHLFSVFDGSRVHQQFAHETKQDAPPGMYFTVINNHVLQSPYKNRFGIYTDRRGESDLFIDALHIDYYFLDEHKTPHTLGTIAFSLCAIMAHLARLSHVSLVAAGGLGFDERYIGYKVWPRLGFDAPIEPYEVADFPHLAHCGRVQEVLSIDTAWWEKRGSQRLMTFDLSPHSISWQKLLPYVSKKLSNGGRS